MQADVTHLQRFYATRLGVLAARLITARIHEIWGNLGGMSVLGLGYATPFLTPMLDKPSSPRAQIKRVIALMPAQQGVMAWPAATEPQPPHRNLAGLVDELQLPLPDASFERIILTHILENTEQTGALLREVWRVLTPGGRLIVIVPNRSGLWAPFESTPFGIGRPYSRPQLCETLEGNMLTPLQWRYALQVPPFNTRAGRKLLSALEYPGHRWFRRLAGVIVMEAEKQIYAVTPNAMAGARKPRRRVTTSVSHQGRNSSRSPS